MTMLRKDLNSEVDLNLEGVDGVELEPLVVSYFLQALGEKEHLSLSRSRLCRRRVRGEFRGGR